MAIRFLVILIVLKMLSKQTEELVETLSPFDSFSPVHTDRTVYLTRAEYKRITHLTDKKPSLQFFF